MSNQFDFISIDVKQKIYECIFQAIGEDRQAADSYMDLKTHVSGPFINWDLIYRNLINAFGDENVKYSTSIRGMWTVLLLYDVKSGFLISFMRDSRLESIRNSSAESRPQYIRALLNLNEGLQAPLKQRVIPGAESVSDQRCTNLMSVLDDLCANFECTVDYKKTRHLLVSFSARLGVLNSLNAYILDDNLDIVSEQDWLGVVNPIISNTIESAEEHYVPKLTLKPKAQNRLKEKELVTLKDQEDKKQA